MDKFEVIVIGAGAAGLSAAARLGSAGLSTLVIEARERLGGRMFTLRDPVCQAPVELGAEFIHGRPPEIWKLLQSKHVKIVEAAGDNWCRRNAALAPCDFFSDIDDILGKMDDRLPDESFLNFLNRCCDDPRITADAKQRALDYVTGFNAADPALVSVHWLVEGMRAEERIDGGRTFRSRNGYQDLVDIFKQQLVDTGVAVRTADRSRKRALDKRPRGDNRPQYRRLLRPGESMCANHITSGSAASSGGDSWSCPVSPHVAGRKT